MKNHVYFGFLKLAFKNFIIKLNICQLCKFQKIRVNNCPNFPEQNIPDKSPFIYFRERGARQLNIIVHYPTSEKALADLKKNVAKVHIEAVLSYVTNLSCSKLQKLELIESLHSAGN